MLIILSIVWGGFGLLLVSALRKERGKRGSDRAAGPPA
jgi:hypothetical protein